MRPAGTAFKVVCLTSTAVLSLTGVLFSLVAADALADAEFTVAGSAACVTGLLFTAALRTACIPGRRSREAAGDGLAAGLDEVRAAPLHAPRDEPTTRLRSSGDTSTRTVSPSTTSPERISRASWSPMVVCTRRRNGRAP